MRMAVNLQSNIGRLAEQLVAEGKKDEAIKVMDECFKNLPASEVPYTVYTIPFVNTYYKAGAPDKAHKVADELLRGAQRDAKVYFQLPSEEIKGIYNRDMQEFLYTMQSLDGFAKENADSVYAKKIDAEFQKMQMQYSQKMQ